MSENRVYATLLAVSGWKILFRVTSIMGTPQGKPSSLAAVNSEVVDRAVCLIGKLVTLKVEGGKIVTLEERRVTEL